MIYTPVFKPHYPDYLCFTVCFETTQCFQTNFVFKIGLATQGPLRFQMILGWFYFCKKEREGGRKEEKVLLGKNATGREEERKEGKCYCSFDRDYSESRLL